jgi:hypothetical protein
MPARTTEKMIVNDLMVFMIGFQIIETICPVAAAQLTAASYQYFQGLSLAPSARA